MTVNVDCTRSEVGYHGPPNTQGKCPWCQTVLWAPGLNSESWGNGSPSRFERDSPSSTLGGSACLIQ